MTLLDPKAEYRFAARGVTGERPGYDVLWANHSATGRDRGTAVRDQKSNWKLA
jgi:hypothetical protein